MASVVGLLSAVGCARRRRMARGGMTFTGLLGAGGVGAYFGAAGAGLFAVVTGQVNDPAAMVGLAVMGAVGGWLLAMLTRWAPAVNRRVLVFVVGGLVSFPLAFSVPWQSHQWAEVGVGLMAVGWLIRAGRYLSAARRGRVLQSPAGMFVRVW